MDQEFQNSCESLKKHLKEGNTKQSLAEWSEAVENSILHTGKIMNINERKNTKDTGWWTYKKGNTYFW